GTAESGQALNYYDQALPISRRAGDRFGEASSLYNIARAERAANRLPEARARIEAALQVIEALRSNVTSQDSRASYFASIRQYYELHVDILMSLAKTQPKQKFDEEAFNSSERARARSFLESLEEAHVNIRTGVDASLLERERALQQALDEKGQQFAKVQDHGSEAETLSKEIDVLTTEYNEVQSRIKTQSPRYAELSQQRPLTLAEVQSRILDDDTILLEYMLGDERSYAWAVTRTEMWSYELPSRGDLERQARSVYSLIATQDSPSDAFQQSQERLVNGNELPAQISKLSQMLLWPMARSLGTKR